MLLGNNRAALDAVIAELLEKETISGEELADTVGRTRSSVDGDQSGVLTTLP